MLELAIKAAWFPASTRPSSFEGTGRQESDSFVDACTKTRETSQILSPYLESQLSVDCVQSFFRVN